MKLTDELIEKGFFRSVKIKDEQILILKTPCRFKILQKVVIKLKENYLDDEEIGGVMRAKPTTVNGENIYIVDDVKFIRNAIEDQPLFDKITGNLLKKSNAYLLDGKQFNEERKNIFNVRCLPIRFHTHPTKGKNIFDSIKYQREQTETSDQDNIASQGFEPIDNQNILMPRGLIVGNKDIGNDIFIGVYDGFIAPPGFEESKRKVQKENINSIGNSITNKISSWNLTDNEKIVYGIGAVLILGYLVYKTRKFSIPVVFCLAAVGSILLTNTGSIEQPNYFNKLSFGDAVIYIPKEDGEYYPK
ncbi:MAG: hypothetical protein HY958_01530 [Bacteroidia bacterium]|nr:hypothetical protein [Bacteroidia bacterium]